MFLRTLVWQNQDGTQGLGMMGKCSTQYTPSHPEVGFLFSFFSVCGMCGSQRITCRSWLSCHSGLKDGIQAVRLGSQCPFPTEPSPWPTSASFQSQNVTSEVLLQVSQPGTLNLDRAETLVTCPHGRLELDHVLGSNRSGTQTEMATWPKPLALATTRPGQAPLG